MSQHSFRPGDLDVSPEEARERHARGEVQLVDVREPYEVRAGRIAGSHHIEMERLAAEAGRLDPDLPVIFYCRVGVRSHVAASAFRRAGYHAQSMAGGLEAWAGTGLPLDPHDGTVADH
jgi:rhodanese-related sulfurtransferase